MLSQRSVRCERNKRALVPRSLSLSFMASLCNPIGPYRSLASRNHLPDVSACCSGSSCSRGCDDALRSIGSPLQGQQRVRLPAQRRNKRMDQLALELAALIISDPPAMDNGRQDLIESWDLLKRRLHPSKTMWDLNDAHWLRFNPCLPPGPDNLPGPPVRFSLPRPSRPARATKCRRKHKAVTPRRKIRPVEPYTFHLATHLVPDVDKIIQEVRRERGRIQLSPPKDFAIQGSPMSICEPTPRCPVPRKDSVGGRVPVGDCSLSPPPSPPGGFLEELRAMGDYNGPSAIESLAKALHCSPEGARRAFDNL